LYEETYLIGVGRDGHIFTFDLKSTQITVPAKSNLRDVDDILSI
jgi:hypothetical protein